MMATESEIRAAAEHLRRGKLVAFPTETVYGLGADATNADAVRRIFLAKGRPATNPLIVHLPTVESFSLAAQVQPGSDEEAVLELLSPLWPGPLSLLLPKAPSIPSETTAGLSRVALRVPAHPVALALLHAVGLPIAAPSANVSNYVSPTTVAHVESALGSFVECILDGGPCTVGVESTVVGLEAGEIVVLRPGGTTLEQIDAVLRSSRFAGRARYATAVGAVVAPGMAPIHYSPRTPVRMLRNFDPEEFPRRIALLTFSPITTPLPFRPTVTLELARDGGLENAARELFSVLRRLDDGSFDLIVFAPCAEEGLGVAIMDRLRRAASAS